MPLPLARAQLWLAALDAALRALDRPCGAATEWAALLVTTSPGGTRRRPSAPCGARPARERGCQAPGTCVRGCGMRASGRTTTPRSCRSPWGRSLCHAASSGGAAAQRGRGMRSFEDPSLFTGNGGAQIRGCADRACLVLQRRIWRRCAGLGVGLCATAPTAPRACAGGERTLSLV